MEIPDFTGPMGGLLATAFISGFVGGWGAAQVFIVKHAQIRNSELRNDMSQLRDEMNHREEICNERMLALEKRLREVEDSRFNFAMKNDAVD